jgi:hypothetical protein
VAVFKALDKAAKGMTLAELRSVDKADLIGDVIANLKQRHIFWSAAKHRHLQMKYKRYEALVTKQIPAYFKLRQTQEELPPQEAPLTVNRASSG